MAIEMGSLVGMVGPDDTTYGYLHGRPAAPSGAQWEKAVAQWRQLPSDEGAAFDTDVTLSGADVAPMVTWGNSSDSVVRVDDVVPDPGSATDSVRKRSMEAALSYMGLQPGQRLSELPVNWVFIGSCTNSRLSDLRAAANLARGRKVAAGVQAWVSAGSVPVKRAAEAEGLDRVFTEAGFQWREPGCSLCLASNGERVPPGERSVSTTNRSFVGRQGPGARTHLASPLTAVASAIRGHIADPRRLDG
jgi:3-isopropylmalate/(R)-2-methylmalate dehydratase large subunit